MDREFTTIAEGGLYFEGARWHEGRWYACDALKGLVCAFDASGRREDLMEVDAMSSGLGWLPDGSMLVVTLEDRKVVRRGLDGTVREHADLSDLSPHWINDMVVNDAGQAWIGTIGFAIQEGEDPVPGELFRVDPDGTAQVVASDLWCPNGMALIEGGRTLVVAETFAARLTGFTVDADGALSDRRVIAQFGPVPEPTDAPSMLASLEVAPDGITADAQDHLWVADAANQRCIRVSPAGRIVDEITHPDGTNVYTCALGGEDGHQLLIAAAEGIFEALAGVDGTAELLTTQVEVGR